VQRAARPVDGGCGWHDAAVTPLGHLRPLLPLVAAALAFASCAEAAATELRGRVVDPSTDADYAVWLVDSLDLADPRLPLAEATIDPESGAFQLSSEGALDDAPHWLFLRQTVTGTDGAPMVFWLPWDLEPLKSSDVHGALEMRSLPVELAIRQRGGDRLPGWWHKPATLLAVLLLAVPLLLLLVRRRAARLGPAEGPPRAPATPPEARRWELPTVSGFLVLAAALRLPRMVREPLELLEHAYGPGIPGIREAAPPPLWETLPRLFGDPAASEQVMQALLEPPSLIVTHPPLYHWLMAALEVGPEWLMRLPALLCSLAVVVLLWRLFRRIGPVAGVVAGGAWAICGPGIHYGSDATPYALVGAVCVGSVLAALRALEDGRSRTWAVWLGALAVGFLCHYTTAIFGLLQLLVLAAAFARHHRDPRWMAALANLLKIVPLIGLLPVLWTFPHFATFEVVGLDTRLMSESYPKTPGFAVFARAMLAVLCGVSPRTWWAALPMVGLATGGLAIIVRRDRMMGALMGACLVAGGLGVVFFYSQHVEILHGRIFWGFRWVSWLVPMVLGIGAVALCTPARPLRTVAVALWIAWIPAALLFSFTPADRSTRPDYRAAARTIAERMQDGDGIATTPMWGQRGPLIWYLGREAGFDVRQPTWQLPVRLWLNPIHEQLPLETSGLNGHVDRLWLARAEERMFGHPKFMLEHADQAIAWAQREMVEVERWSFESLELFLFERGAGGAWDGSEPLEIGHPQFDLSSIRWQEPNVWHCGQPASFEELRPQDPGARSGWRLLLRVPLADDIGPIRAVATEGALSLRSEPGFWSAVVDGGQCGDAPPTVRLTVER
jgi:hypothetical protein